MWPSMLRDFLNRQKALTKKGKIDKLDLIITKDFSKKHH